jgi:hypothetical protein
VVVILHSRNWDKQIFLSKLPVEMILHITVMDLQLIPFNSLCGGDIELYR